MPTTRAPATTCQQRDGFCLGRLGSVLRRQRRARLNVISHLISLIPYEDLKREKPILPKREKAHGYVEPDYPYNFVPEIGWSQNSGQQQRPEGFVTSGRIWTSDNRGWRLIRR